ncbi:MAG TPA: efflux transporter outer membrane subunit [Steroidobacteraceae bacterium]|nr:efflux transporter outer membrane subunit [Steroidobacteraceae bacterium]
MRAAGSATRGGALAIALLCSVAGSGCTVVGPDFERPEVPWLDVAEAAPAAPAATPAPAPPAEWWRVFGDPVLDRIVAEAQRSNPSVKVAAVRIMEARAQLGVAGSTLYPQLQQANADVLQSGEVVSDADDSDLTSYRAGFDIAWELDFWGKFRRGIEAADAAYFASIAQYDDVQVLVAAQAADLYAIIRTVELRLKITRDNAALQQRSLEITERLFRSGNESELDVQQARSLYLGTISTIPALELDLHQAQNALSTLLGRPPGGLVEMSTGREVIPEAALEVVVDLPASLLRRRPDVRAAEMQLATQSALIGVSEAQLYPSIALVGSLGLSSTSLAWSTQTLDWAAGSSLVWNVFDYGRLRNDVLVQDARFQQLHEVYQDTVLRAARELDDAAVAFAKNKAQVAILEQAVQAARRSLDIATIQYQEGLVDFERVLDSQRSLFSQQERLVATRGGVAQSLVALYKATGGGWEGGRGRQVLDDGTRADMTERSDWNNLLNAPLPAPTEPFLPSAQGGP